MGSAVLPVEGPLRLALVALGVDDRGEVAAHPVELGGVEASGLLDHDLLAAAACVWGASGSRSTASTITRGLVGRHLGVAQGVQGHPRARRCSSSRPLDRAPALASGWSRRGG